MKYPNTRLVFLWIISVLQTFASPLVIAQEPEAKQLLTTKTFVHKITFEVQRIKQLKGRLFYQLFACPQKKTALWSELTLLEAADLPVTQSDIPFSLKTTHHGDFIIRVFQDINENSILDYASNDIPKEPFGFSNNPNPMSGEPEPSETCFNSVENSPLIIKMNNKRKRRAH